MANNALSNGRVPHQSSDQRPRNERVSSHKQKRVPDIPAVESRDWLLHRYYTRHEYETCKNLIEEQLTTSNGHNEYANYLKGLILRKEGKIRESMDSFKNSYNVNSTNVNSVKEIAKSLFLLGSHEQAVEAYIQAAEMSSGSPPDWEIHYNLGQCYIKLGREEDARRELERAIELTTNESPYLALARLHLTNNRIDDAISVYSGALKFRSENEDAATELGLLYLRIGDSRRAFQEFGSVLASCRSPLLDSKALFPMARIIQSHGEHDVALSKYKVIAQSTPESSYLWNNVGMCFYGKQKYVAAISCLKRAHYLNPMAVFPACNLGRVLLTTGQPASAAVYLCSAISASPNESLPYLLLGLALERLGDREGAERALSKAHLLAPQDPLTLVNYAIILEATNKCDQATEMLRAFDDITAIVDVDEDIIQSARNLGAKIRRKNEDEQRDPRTVQTLTEDEV